MRNQSCGTILAQNRPYLWKFNFQTLKIRTSTIVEHQSSVGFMKENLIRICDVNNNGVSL